MAHTEHKIVSLLDKDAPSDAALGSVSANTPLRWHPMRGLLRAQDPIVGASRRVVAEWSLGGADQWNTPAGTVDPDSATTQEYPNTDTWRKVHGPVKVRLTPGSYLEAHVMFCPSGLRQEFVTPDWFSDGAAAEIRVGVDWSNGAATAGTDYYTAFLEGSAKGTWGGAENTAAGEDWFDLKERKIERIWPAGVDDEPDTATSYSEYTTAEITIEVRGGDRVVHCPVYEKPRLYAVDHDNSGAVSVHVAPPLFTPASPGPQTKPADGASFEEHRLGTTRMLQVAQEQGEKLGPRPFLFSHFDATSERWLDSEADIEPISISFQRGVTWVDILDTTITTWSQDNPGWILAGSHALLHRLNDPDMILRGEAAVIPVRVSFDCEWTDGGGGGSGRIKIQSGTYEWVEAEFTSSGTRSVIEVTGHLESQVNADHAWANVQVFGYVVTSGTLEIFNVWAEFGEDVYL